MFQFSMPTPESASAAAYGSAPGGSMPYQAQPGFGVGYFVSGLKCHWYSQTPSESSGSVTESFPFFISGGEKMDWTENFANCL